MTMPQTVATPPALVGPTNPPGPQAAQPAKPPSTFPEQTALFVEVLRTTNTDLTQQLQNERANLNLAMQECKGLIAEKAELLAKNAKLEGEQKRLLDHFNEVRQLRAADRARHAIVAFITTLTNSISAGMISATTGDTQKIWIIVLVAGSLLLFLYSVLVYSDDIRRGLRKYGILGGLWRLLFGNEEAGAISSNAEQPPK